MGLLTIKPTHILRHSFATDFLAETQNHHALKSILGHAEVKQTEHYAKVTEGLVSNGFIKYEESLTAKTIDDNESNVVALLVNAGK